MALARNKEAKIETDYHVIKSPLTSFITCHDERFYFPLVHSFVSTIWSNGQVTQIYRLILRVVSLTFFFFL